MRVLTILVPIPRHSIDGLVRQDFNVTFFRVMVSQRQFFGLAEVVGKSRELHCGNILIWKTAASGRAIPVARQRPCHGRGVVADQCR